MIKKLSLEIEQASAVVFRGCGLSLNYIAQYLFFKSLINMNGTNSTF